jgi:hypothetical protein
MANNSGQHDASLPLVRLLMDVVEKLGITTTKSILAKAARQCSAAEEKQKAAILAAVCAVMDIRMQYLLDKELYSRDEQKKWSITFTIVLINEKMGWQAEQIAPLFGMTNKNIFSRIYEFRNLDKNSAVDSHRLEQYRKILKTVKKK